MIRHGDSALPRAHDSGVKRAPVPVIGQAVGVQAYGPQWKSCVRKRLSAAALAAVLTDRDHSVQV